MIDMNELTDLQKQLMAKVPHGLRDDVRPTVIYAPKVIHNLLLYLTSLGHKPWRPNPLPEEEQARRFATFLESALQLRAFAKMRVDEDIEINPIYDRQVISGLGIIEETIEYLYTLGEKDSNGLEEFTDILFFYLESKIMAGFTWDQIRDEYKRKHAVNLARYEAGKQGDYRWDKRAEGSL